MPHGEWPGEPLSRAPSEAPLDRGGGATPSLVQIPAGTANLINTAQVTPARRVLHRSYVFGLMRQALSAGGVRKSLTHVHWDVSAGCETPHIVELEGRLDPLRVTDHPSIVSQGSSFYFRENVPQQASLSLTVETKCRRCRVCLQRRSAEWRIRAEAEINAAPRTWFGTLTLSPSAHAIAVYRADQRLSRGGTLLGNLSPDEQFSEVHKEIGKDLTKWLKRVRKESGAKLRYCLVAEAHKTGLPHYHVLIHEVSGSETVKERTLRRQWIAGFSRFNLVSNKIAARYVCKYLSKSSLARVRASVDYGNSPLGK